MRYHLVFSVFFIHLFFLMNIYIKDKISPPENYVTCGFLDISVESLKCHQNDLANSKQLLHYNAQWDSLDKASYQETKKLIKTGIKYDEFNLEYVKLHLRLQKIDGKIAQITDTTPPRIISALQRQRNHLMLKIDDFFDRYTKHSDKAKAFYATISYD